MEFPLTKFAGIMFFYAVLSFLLGPLVFYYALGKTAKNAGKGYVVGSILSIILWFTYGSKMV